MLSHRPQFQQDRQFTRGVGGIRGNIREMVTLPN